VSNDETNRHLAFIESPGLDADPDRAQHDRLQRFAFEYRNLNDLLGIRARLKKRDILPVQKPPLRLARSSKKPGEWERTHY
jgi:hypothetical protein